MPTAVFGSSFVLIAGGALTLAVVLVLVVRFLRGLRNKGRAVIDARYAPSDVLLTETMAQSFGLQSKGAAQLRGNGALALTKSELFFGMYVIQRDVIIPIRAIQAVSLVRSHLGKTQFTDLLHVRWTAESGEDAIAWRVPDPSAWKHQLDSLRG